MATGNLLSKTPDLSGRISTPGSMTGKLSAAGSLYGTIAEATKHVFVPISVLNNLLGIIGNLDALETSAKSDLVAAINELAQSMDPEEIAAVIREALQEAKESGAFDGDDGVTFTPAMSMSGDLSWSNDRNLPNPETVNLTGPPGPKGSDAEIEPLTNMRLEEILI